MSLKINIYAIDYKSIPWLFHHFTTQKLEDFAR